MINRPHTERELSTGVTPGLIAAADASVDAMTTALSLSTSVRLTAGTALEPRWALLARRAARLRDAPDDIQIEIALNPLTTNAVQGEPDAVLAVLAQLGSELS